MVSSTKLFFNIHAYLKGRKEIQVISYLTRNCSLRFKIYFWISIPVLIWTIVSDESEESEESEEGSSEESEERHVKRDDGKLN